MLFPPVPWEIRMSGYLPALTGASSAAMNVYGPNVCSRDGESLHTSDRKEVLRFLACDGGARDVVLAEDFLDSMQADAAADTRLAAPIISD